MTTLKDVQIQIFKDRIKMLEFKEKKLEHIEKLFKCFDKHGSYLPISLLFDIKKILMEVKK